MTERYRDGLKTDSPEPSLNRSSCYSMGSPTAVTIATARLGRPPPSCG
jgi:hypothetical protein